MDPITIIGAIGNVIQFLEFGHKLISNSVELYHSSNGALAETTDTEATMNHLCLLSDKLKDSAAKTGDETLRELCKSCEAAADELLVVLDKVKVKNKHSKWESIRKALRTVWNKEEISELELRLTKFREKLNLHVTVDLRSAPSLQKKKKKKGPR